jgi:acylpyruvate hydrolase
MNLATVAYEGQTYAARVVSDTAQLLDARDVGQVLSQPGGIEGASGAPASAEVAWSEVTPLPVVPHPAKVMCIGLNYVRHIEEVGQERPAHPTVFAKYARALIGDRAQIILPAASSKVDWEVELVVVIGHLLRHATPEEAAGGIAGFTVGNDISARDWQNRTSQWLQGKTWEATTPVGPWLTTVDATGPEPDLAITCSVDGQERQASRTSDLLFKPVDLVCYLSDIVTLEPGDLIFTGTPGGVGQGMKPPVFLSDGQTVVSTIEGIGSLQNTCRAEAP